MEALARLQYSTLYTILYTIHSILHTVPATFLMSLTMDACGMTVLVPETARLCSGTVFSLGRLGAASPSVLSYTVIKIQTD